MPEAVPAGSEGLEDRRARLYRSIVEDATEMIVAVDGDGYIRFANPATATILGLPPEEMVGRHVIDFVHVDDVERAAEGLSAQAEWGPALGATSFRLRHGDGSVAWVDVTAADVTDGDERYVAVFVRRSEDQHSSRLVLTRLLSGAAPVETMAPVLDLFEWQLNGSTIGVVWRDDVGLHHVCTADVPAALVGGDREPGEPWRRAQDTGVGVHDHEQALLDDHRRALARTHRLGPLWVEPVVTTEGSVVALITIWSRPAGRGPEGHVYGMTLAKSHVELIVRWGQQLRRLEHSAHHDTLTGLANRKAFFDALGAGGSEVGALLYCDLDRFKPVNDELGHAAGDDLLRQVGARLRAAVRDGDLVARIGGDEFCVLCRGASAAEAAEVAARITRAFDPPFEVAGRPVVIGISIGIAHARDGMGDHTLEEADRALYETKQARRPQ